MRTLWFEVEDLLWYFDHFRSPSGIQRVAFELLDRFQADATLGRSRIFRISRFTGRLEQISWGALQRAVPSRSPLVWSPFGGISRAVRDRIQAVDSREELPDSGDVVISLGGPWIDAQYSRRIAALRSRKVKFVQLIHDLIPALISASREWICCWARVCC